MPQRNLALFSKADNSLLATGTRRELKMWLRNSGLSQKNVYFGAVPGAEVTKEAPEEPEVFTTSMDDNPNTEGFLKKLFD